MITGAEPKPADSASMIANTNVASAPAPRMVPAVSTRAAVGSELSGRMTAATISAASPNARLNQKMPRQLHSPVSTPPTTGPAASANPDVAAQMPTARFLARASGYRWSSVDRVARASPWPPRGMTPPRWRSPETVSACLAIGTVLAAHRGCGAGVLELEQLAEAHVPDLP